MILPDLESFMAYKYTLNDKTKNRDSHIISLICRVLYRTRLVSENTRIICAGVRKRLDSERFVFPFRTQINLIHVFSYTNHAFYLSGHQNKYTSFAYMFFTLF